ncbi:MAG: helix-turn-helix transcriptional regulator [Alphaproteobacteria bacterium]|nr:helix-turn-helix transcriptional regulator [Alphaproteobacteria bacterium]
MALTRAQCRAARALLGITQVQLAHKSGVSLRTIASFEAKEHDPIPANLAAMRRALESSGVIFLDSNGEGPGVRLKARR